MADDSPITVGTVVNAWATMPQLYVDGQLVSAPNVFGGWLQTGQSVTVMRLGNGRYQMLGFAGYWGPPPP
jgi:hypothetical protein